MEDYPSLSAYVSFNEIKSKYECVDKYHKANNQCCGKIPEELLLKFQNKNYKLEVKQMAAEPSTIKWENLE